MSAHMEREVKLRFDSPELARAALLSLGAVPLRPRRLQSDTVFDLPERTLAARAQVLRVRVEDGNHCVTFKSPIPDETMKLREELETSVGSGVLVMSILERLGFVVSFRYEKYREEFTLVGIVAAVDETPVGTFVELEGTEDGILSVAEALGRSPQQFVLDSYRTLFVQACAATGTAVTDMVFAR
jgi:adenylate cyclase, class 2